MPIIDPSEKHLTGWRRFFASLIDGFVFIPLMPLDDAVSTLKFPAPVQLWWIILFALLPHFYQIYFVYKSGQTFGKMIANVKVVNLTGLPVNLKQAILRNGVQIVFAIILIIPNIIREISGLSNHINADNAENILLFVFGVWLLVDGIIIFTNEERRALHDFIAGTVVIRTSI